MRHDVKGFKALLEQHEIFTRLVPCRIEFAYTLLGELGDKNTLDSENSESSRLESSPAQALQEQLRSEFLALSRQRHGSLSQWLNKIKSKARNEETDEVLLELLVELYQKVEHIEQILLNQNRPLISLDSKAEACFIGHNVLCVSESSLKSNPESSLDSENAPTPCFVQGREYYLRLFLPIFPQRYVGIYARALSEQILHFTQIHPNDVRDFDSFVVSLEREAILDSKLSQRHEEE